jgi:diaminopimelate epimerase
MQSTEETLSRVVIVYPSGNTTAVVFDRLQGKNLQDLNSRIIETWQTQYPDQPQIEQCCFITTPADPSAVARVEMFGGEFCGNATRSAIWAVTGGKNKQGLVEVSGTNQLLRFSVRDGEVTVEIPLPKEALTKAATEGILVNLDGITHLVVTSAEVQQAKSPRELLNELLTFNRYNLRNLPSVGVDYYDLLSRKAEFCVWVNAVDTIFDETACGSGTSAIGIVLAEEARESIDQQVIQPSGESIITRATYADEKVIASTITGTVSILYDGALQLP